MFENFLGYFIQAKVKEDVNEDERIGLTM